MKLALGTVQFGMGYGISSAGQAVPESQVESILDCAQACGIDLLDTAAAYGDIEPRLSRLVGRRPMRVVSKVPPMPPGLDQATAAQWAQSAVLSSRERLGDLLCALLFHRADDLQGPTGPAIWASAAGACGPAGIALGASVYDWETVDRLLPRAPMALVQGPGNPLDQRIHAWRPTGSIPGVHLRSAFLQGLLLMPETAAARRLPAAAGALRAWHAWCARRELDPLLACLSVVKGMPHVTHCVVGVDTAAQLEAIAYAWAEARPIAAPEIASTDLSVIDPRAWRVEHGVDSRP